MRELSALHTKRLMVTFDESEAERERNVEDATREVGNVNRSAERADRLESGGAGGMPPLNIPTFRRFLKKKEPLYMTSADGP